MTGSRFIEVPATALLAELDAIGAAVTKIGGRFALDRAGKEIVRALIPPNSHAEVRIYTSIARGEDTVRGCGEDAIRIFWGAELPGAAGSDRFKPLSKAVRVFRTAPKGPPERRLLAFLVRFRDAVREVYKAAAHAPRCSACGYPAVLRSSRGDAFYGCCRFPDCKATRPAPPMSAADAVDGSRRAGPPRRCNELRSGHEVVAAYGLPHGEMALQQVEAGLDAEVASDPFGHAMHEGGSALAQDLIRNARGGYGRRGF